MRDAGCGMRCVMPNARCVMRVMRNAGCVMLALAIGCVDRLPDQDMRILNATPVAKISSDLLWKDYAADAKAADKRYWGKAIEMSGRISTVIPEAPQRLMFLPE